MLQQGGELVKIGVIGRVSPDMVDGQTVSTRLLVEKIGLMDEVDEVTVADLSHYKKTPVKALIGVLKCFVSCDAIIIVLSINGLAVVMPIARFFSERGKAVYLRAVGAGLDRFALKNSRLKRELQSLKELWVQSQSALDSLFEQGITNCRRIDNFRDYPGYDADGVRSGIAKRAERGSWSFRVCTFSRVVKDKGIEDAVAVVNRINQEGTFSVSLDIIGQIDPDYMEYFRGLCGGFGGLITYKGVIAQQDVISTLNQYDALLFPTYFSGEAFPGSLVDAFAAGVPVVASDWNCNPDIVADGETGFLYPTHDNERFYRAVKQLLNDRDRLLGMSMRCLEEYQKYTSNVVLPKMMRPILSEQEKCNERA